MAKILQNSYYIYKIPSNKIGKLSIYSFKEASRDGNVVSIGDNLVLAKIREYYNDTRDHVSLYNQIQAIRKEMKEIRKQPTSDENIKAVKSLQSTLDNLLFVDDIVNIKVVAKKEYKKIAREGFTLNGKHYVRFMVGAGQMRRNTVSFVNEKLLPYLQESLMCGLDGKIRTINLAKLSAYYALSFSSVLWVREPRVCVISDFFTQIKDQEVNFLMEGKEGTTINKIKKDFDLNSADGQGLIDPNFAKLWANDMHLNYVPSSFVIRTTFIKGNLVPFDFKEYAKQNNIKTIKDRYGVEYNINEIDVLLSESQFKMAKYYSSWEVYLSYHHTYNLKWGVARYNKAYDEEYVLTNYQYLQVLNLNKEDILGLISYTKNWIKNICSGDKVYSMLYNIGVKKEEENIDSIINSCGSAFSKAIVKNPNLLNDGFIQRKIYSSIKESIRQAKLGRIWVRGNYEFMISDPIMQCRSALGLTLEGGIPANHVYSNFWNERGEKKEIVCCRSPLTIASEVVPLKIYNDEESSYWYQYIKSGIIYSVYDIATLRHADSDFDGDIVFSTNNPYFIKGAQREELAVTYDKEKVPTQKITLPNQIKCDLRGLDTKVGQITNYSTSMIGMLPLFDKEGQKFQFQELKKRINICRMLQGQEIDKIKGTTPPSFPKEWRCLNKIDEEDTDEIKALKYQHNSMVVRKKPYFFIYLYPSLMESYKNYKKNFDNLCLKNYGMNIKELILKEEKTDGEANFLRKYKKYSPVLETDCLMNILCKDFEDVEFDIAYKNYAPSMIQNYFDKDFVPDNDILYKLYIYYREFKSTKSFKKVEAMVDSEYIRDEDTIEIINNIMYTAKDSVREKMYSLISSSKELYNYLICMCDKYGINNYDIVWDILKDDVINIIPYENNFFVEECENGYEYLGKRYRIRRQ